MDVLGDKKLPPVMQESQEGRRSLVEEDLPEDKNTRQEEADSSCDAEKSGEEEIKEVCLVSSLIQSVSSQVFLFFIAHFAFLRCSFNEGLFKRGNRDFPALREMNLNLRARRIYTGKGDPRLDSKEYEGIIAKYINTVYRIALSFTKSPADADDIVQQTFLKLLTKNVNFRDEEHIRRWLIRVCVNECNRMVSSFWHKKVDSLEMTEGPAFQTEENKELYEAVMALPGKCRIVVYLFYYEGYSSKEIAKLLHIRDATVRTRLTRARKLLREAWTSEE